MGLEVLVLLVEETCAPEGCFRFVPIDGPSLDWSARPLPLFAELLAALLEAAVTLLHDLASFKLEVLVFFATGLALVLRPETAAALVLRLGSCGVGAAPAGLLILIVSRPPALSYLRSLTP